MPGGSKGPGVRGLEDKAARIAAAVINKPTVDQFYALKGDLELLNSSIQQENCSGQQLTAVLASRIPADLARTAMAGLELLGKAGSATSEAAKNLSDPLDLLGRPLLYCVSAAAATGGKIAVPQSFLASWADAAAPAAAYLQQHSQESPPTATTRAVLSTAVALLRLWRVAAMQQLAARGSAAAAAPTSHVVTTMPVAADLSVLLLTSPAAAAAFAQEVQVMAPGQASVKYLQFAAATSLHIMSSLVAFAGRKVMGPQHPVLPAAFAHDSVQRALVLHLAACMPYCVQQMTQQQNKPSSSKKAAGSSKAPSASAAAAADATAREVLQQLGFQRLQDVQQYGRVACDAAGVAPQPPDGDTPRGHLASAYGGIQLAFVLRRQAMGHPQWPDLYKGAITRPSPLATQLAVDPLLAPVMAPGVDPVLLLELLLQLVVVLGPSDEVSLSATLGIGTNSLQPATSRMADKARVAKCLQLMWLGVGRDLLAAAGVGGADLDADAEDSEGGSSGSSSTQQQLQTDGSTVEVAVRADELLKQYGYLLLLAFVWNQEFSPHPQVAQELMQQQPQLACRVIEAAARACIWPTPYAPPQAGIADRARHFQGLCMAHGACLPVSPELSVLAISGRKPKLVSRLCSLAVSASKQVQLQLAPSNAMLPGWHGSVLPAMLNLAVNLAYTGLGSARAVTFANTVLGQSALAIQLANDTPLTEASTAWLALTGRSLLLVGRVLAVSGPLLTRLLGSEGEDLVMAAQLVSMRGAILHHLCKPEVILTWLKHQLALLATAQQQQEGVSAFWVKALGRTRSVKQAVDGKVLHKLQKLAGELHEKLQPLQVLYSAGDVRSSSTQEQAAALKGYSEACGEGGWLPAALRELGEALAAAFPHKWACNDPECVNMAALTEMSAAKKACTDCKVARYCCKEHQLRHWPQHKKACKAIKQALAASASL